MPVDAAAGKDAGSTRDASRDHSADLRPSDAPDAPLDHGIDAIQMDASTTDADSGAVGLTCPQSPSLASTCPTTLTFASTCAPTWDAIVSDPYYCRDGVAANPLFVTETCGEYRLLEDDSNGDLVLFYYYDALGAITAVVERLGNTFRCVAGAVPFIAYPCIYLNSPEAAKVMCATDGGDRG